LCGRKRTGEGGREVVWMGCGHAVWYKKIKDNGKSSGKEGRKERLRVDVCLKRMGLVP
jgi:hypothetical protein